MLETTLGGGLTNVFSYDNIAIVVLAMCLICSITLNIKLVMALLGLKDAFASVATLLAVLNERLHSKD